MIGLMLAAGLALPQVQGDFDGDGRADVARVEPRERGYALVVQRAAAEAPETILYINDVTGLRLSLQPPGKWATICAKDIGLACRPGERRKVKIKGGDVLAVGMEEGFSAVALWTGDGFEIEYLSD